MNLSQPMKASAVREDSQSITATPRKILSRLLPFIVFLFPFLLYLPTVRFDFLAWDDDIEITTNPYIRELSAATLHWMFTDTARVRRYIPLDWLSWGINYQVAKAFTGDGLNPALYHLGNALFHAATALLLFWILRRILHRMTNENPPSLNAASLIAAFGALYWALHPLRVEAVAWANGRIHEQATFFITVSFLCYLRAYDPPRRRGGRVTWLICSILAYFCSLLSYGTTLGYVVVLLVADILLLGRRNYRILPNKIPFALAAVTWVAVALWASSHASGIWQKPVSLAQFGIFDRVMQASYLLAYYCWKPWSLHFAPVYTTLVGFDPFSPPFLVSLLFVIGVTLFAWVVRKRWPLLSGLWLCHIALLFPMLGWTEHPHYPSDRYTYTEGMLWSVLLCALIVYLLWMPRPWARTLAVAGPIVLLISSAAISIPQIAVWHTSETLFQHTIVELNGEPYAAEMHRRLADYYRTQRRFDEAIQHYDVAIEMVPNYTLALQGRELALRGKHYMPPATASSTPAQ